MNAWGRTEVKTRQRTFEVDGEKVTVKSRQRIYMHAPAGFHVWINGEKFLVPGALIRSDAEDHAFAKWMRSK